MMRDNTSIKLMQKRGFWLYTKIVLLAVLIVSGSVTTVSAQSTSESNNYQASELQFGSGSNLDSCSASFCARATIGDAVSGVSKGEKTTATFGPVTPDEPLLEVIVETGPSDLGNLTTERTATKVMKVKVRSYLSDGYMLQIVGDPPKYGNHKLNAPATPVASQPGKEQFAINAVANTTPNIGANPIQVPSGEFSFGDVTDNYKTPNLFKYTSGQVVGRSLTESGQTDYTISMIINVANSTPAGHYSGDFAAVVIPEY